MSESCAAPPGVALSRPLTKLLPAKAAGALRKQAGLVTAGDLLWWLPRRYLTRHTDLGAITAGDYVVFVGTVTQARTRTMKTRRGTMLNATVRNGDQELDLTFFSAWGHQGALTPGRSGLFAGQVSRYGNRWQLAHPAYELFPEDADAAPSGTGEASIGQSREHTGAGGLIPVYREAGTLQSWTISRCVQLVLDGVGELPDPVPQPVRARRRLPSLTRAMWLVHRPATHAEHAQGRHRLTYDEAFALQVVLAQRRRAQAAITTRGRTPRPGGLLEAFDARLPFRLTDGQRAVAAQIGADLAGSHPMHRLLQGEVGSGKTVVALRAMLTVVDSGGQAALLAPTEVLAAQHHRSITAMLGDLAMAGMLGGSEVGTRVALLTGSQSASVRKAALLDAASGAAGIVIGTHALIQDRVQFADLALVVVDEQHRFGVQQRDALRGKADTPPHMLVMTATPIPRTVAMTVFGDMATSVLSELPGGRHPIASHVVDNDRWYARSWRRVAEEIAAGHQVYVVCPRIGATDTDTELVGDTGLAGDTGVAGDTEPAGETEPGSDADTDGMGPGGPAPDRPARGVLQVLEEVRALPELSGARVELLHGRLPTDVKDAVMADFTAGRIDVLVATTVIEVGVDVANATVMVVMDADRFGVSQLHQLRGRVGRGNAPGLCLFVTETDSPAALDRLGEVAATTDGFALAELDLRHRREGDVLGERQSGRRGRLRLLSLLEHGELIEQARHDAAELVASDPELTGYPELARTVADLLDEEQAAFLERG